MNECLEAPAEPETQHGEPRRRIAVLPPEEARKIAAGEVIDRPAALVREFIDNAIDADSEVIEVSIDGGGIRRTEVADDGSGMDEADLGLCWKDHATSKIRGMKDLITAGTLGFRGEALAAAAAVSNLEILTSTDGRRAWRLQVGPTENLFPKIEQTRRTKGTTVRATNLFDTMPVRKGFLKREWSEASTCKAAFLEKALAFPDISFRFTQDGALKTYLPAVLGKKERFAAALLHRSEAPFLHEINAAGPGFEITVVVGGAEIFRNDRRHQYVFANGRRIQDFSLIQALEYGVQGWFPNSTHPIGAIYITIDPAQADFNIHPAKREVRFTDSGTIHHAITQSIRDFVHSRSFLSPKLPEESALPNLSFPNEPGSYPSAAGYGRREAGYRPREPWYHPNYFPQGGEPERPWGLSVGARLAEEALRDDGPQRAPNPADALPGEAAASGELKYAGRLFDLFIMVEKDNRLYIIDQHAAHERLLYDRFLADPIPRQDLLVSIPFRTESEEDDRFLESRREELARLGVVVEAERGIWRIDALPAAWRLGEQETIKAILNLKSAGENMAEHWAATLSCHHAVKDGEYLDEAGALNLAAAVLNLPVPRCPHGRPLWFEITREDLFKGVKRF